MTTTHSQPVGVDGAATGWRSDAACFAGGAFIAFLVALLTSVVPAELFEPESAALAGLFVAVAIAAVATVWSLSRFVETKRLQRTINEGLWGALAFDGLAIAFVPSLYKHDGPLLASVGASLLWGVCCFGVAVALVRTNGGALPTAMEADAVVDPPIDQHIGTSADGLGASGRSEQ